ncbi:hypothetical protein V8C37DRAFT_397523 [Trichoderma ceciliae]
MSLGDKSNMTVGLFILFYFCFFSSSTPPPPQRYNTILEMSTIGIIMSVGVIAMAICAALTTYRMYSPLLQLA